MHFCNSKICKNSQWKLLIPQYTELDHSICLVATFLSCSHYFYHRQLALCFISFQKGDSFWNITSFVLTHWTKLEFVHLFLWSFSHPWLFLNVNSGQTLDNESWPVCWRWRWRHFLLLCQNLCPGSSHGMEYWYYYTTYVYSSSKYFGGHME